MKLTVVAIVLSGAALAGAVGGVLTSIGGSSTAPTSKLVAATGVATAAGEAAEPIADCLVVDGDTIRCGAERVRLLGIDAPERPGNCQVFRQCAPGDYYASTASLSAALSGPLVIQRVGLDRYGRTLALMRGRSGDLSCWQLRSGQAIYRADWDNGGRLAAICNEAPEPNAGFPRKD